MAKVRVDYASHFELVMKAMTQRGLLLGAYDAKGKPNLMTIGWGSVGSIWSIPTWIVLVRPSRYTYRCIEHSQCFTVNVPTEAMRDACAICGSTSGLDTDKFAQAHLTPQKASTVLAPIVAECPMVFECQVVHSNDVLPSKLTDEIVSGSYMDGDFHRIYYGRIMAAWAEPDAAKLLAE